MLTQNLSFPHIHQISSNANLFTMKTWRNVCILKDFLAGKPPYDYTRVQNVGRSINRLKANYFSKLPQTCPKSYKKRKVVGDWVTIPLLYVRCWSPCTWKLYWLHASSEGWPAFKDRQTESYKHAIHIKIRVRC